MNYPENLSINEDAASKERPDLSISQVVDKAFELINSRKLILQNVDLLDGDSTNPESAESSEQARAFLAEQGVASSEMSAGELSNALNELKDEANENVKAFAEEHNDVLVAEAQRLSVERDEKANELDIIKRTVSEESYTVDSLRNRLPVQAKDEQALSDYLIQVAMRKPKLMEKLARNGEASPDFAKRDEIMNQIDALTIELDGNPTDKTNGKRAELVGVEAEKDGFLGRNKASKAERSKTLKAEIVRLEERSADLKTKYSEEHKEAVNLADAINKQVRDVPGLSIAIINSKRDGVSVQEALRGLIRQVQKGSSKDRERINQHDQLVQLIPQLEVEIIGIEERRSRLSDVWQRK